MHDGTARRYKVAIIVGRNGGDHPNQAELAMAAAEQVVSARAAIIVSTQTASQIISVVTVLAADQPAAVAVTLAVVSDAKASGCVTPSAQVGRPR